MTTCLNCSNAFEGNFCNECGQKAATHRFTMHEWLHEIPHSIFHVDGGFFYTLKNLCLRPGKMMREYVEGRRKIYFSPFLYLLIWCGIFIVINHFVSDATAAKKEITDLKSAGAYLVANYYKVLIVAMILPMSLSSFLIFYRSGFNFAEHLVLSAFITAQLIIGDVVVYSVAAINFTQGKTQILLVLNLLLKFPFWIWAYWQFFKPKNRLVGALQVFATIFLCTLLSQAMLEGAVYLLFLLKGSH
ncbi:MAG TPA: DUF3667 domain-containing protein [Pyrinomonadaceae bacterium]